ncbi:MAG: MetQ/NlpA family ABC transporter substrate-binding protein [Dehalococcoidia bacterium]|nr:MetQ/NlpA family ABC transporter substrate-binding protein [Dehalococcoidia bacterium]
MKYFWFRTWLLIIAMAMAAAMLPACGEKEPQKLTIGLLPIIDSLPFYVAEQQGYFKDEGLQVEFVTFTSALERDTALQTGQTDGQLADLIATGLLNKDQERVKIVKSTYAATPQRAMISLIAGPGGKISSPADLRGKKIGVSENSLIDYITDELLGTAGLSAKDVQKVGVPSIAVRMQMLTQGQLDAATLPDPFATLAVQSGGFVVLSDSAERIGVSVLEFRKEVLEKQKDAVKRLVRAHEKGVKAVNASPEKYRALLVEKARLPDVVKESFPVPAFPENAIPSKADVKRAVDWMMKVRMLPRALSYEQMVDTSYLQ